MNRVPQPFLGLLLTLAVTSAIAFAVPDLVLMGLFLFILPGMILGLSPTFLFYLVIFLLPWLVLRRTNKWAAVGAGTAAVATIAFGVPLALNEQTQQNMDEAAQSDIVPGSPITPVRTIALLPEGGYSQSAESCADLCLMLLYNGVAERVISLVPEGQRRAEATLFRIERREVCDAGAIADRRTWTSDETARTIADATRLRVAGGECLIDEPPGDARPDLTIVRRADIAERRQRDRLALRAGQIDSQWVEARAGDSVVARVGERRSRMLLIPLFLNLPMTGGGGGFTVGPWEWGRSKVEDPKLDILAALGRTTSFDLSIPNSGETTSPTGDVSISTTLDQLREAIDAALDDVTAAESDSRFALIGDYYKALQNSDVQPDDAERLARLIADERVQQFQRFPSTALKLDDAAERFRGPLLDRISRRATDPEDATYVLQKLAARLPPGAYRENYAELDALLATREGRVRFAALIPRVADRGTGAIPRLLAIMRESSESENPGSNRAARGGRKRRNDDNWRSGGVAAAALQGLCMLGRDAAPALPELRRIEADGILPPNMRGLDRWRKSLVKIGAPASEFEKPANMSGSQSRYEERLARDAQRTSCSSF